MPANTQHPDAEWARVKPIIEVEYLTKNRSAKAVQAHLKEHYNFDTTVRKLKLKFELWRWDKKTNARNYAAMSRVIQDVGNHIVFIVPKMGGRSFSRKEACKVLKEARRKDTTNLKRGKPAIPSPDLKLAYQILEEAGITIEPLHNNQVQPVLAADGSIAPQIWQAQSSRPTQLQAAPSDDDDDSTVSDDSMDEPDLIADSSRELNLENFRPRSRSGQRTGEQLRSDQSNQQRVKDALPFEAAFLADLHRNIFPHTDHYQISGPEVTIAQGNAGPHGAAIDPVFDSIGFVDFSDMSVSPALSRTQRAAREKVLYAALKEYYRRNDHDGQRRQVLEFSAYYVGQFLAGNETLDDYNHADRRDARDKLYDMLEHRNTQLLPHCYWLSNVVISCDKFRQLLAFYEDCIECIETSQSEFANVLRPWIRFVVIMHRDSYAATAVQSSRLSPAALDQLKENFDAAHELTGSINYLEAHDQGGSHTCLILRVYRAWYLCHCERQVEGLNELLICLPQAEKIFGGKHLVTINCNAMAARAYEKLNSEKIARIYVETALCRLEPCSRFLLSTYHQLLLRLARFQLAHSEMQEAQKNLEKVFDFRLHEFGAQAFKTWEVAHLLFDTLARLGLAHIAHEREAQLRALHDEEWKRHPITYPHRQ